MIYPQTRTHLQYVRACGAAIPRHEPVARIDLRATRISARGASALARFADPLFRGTPFGSLSLFHTHIHTLSLSLSLSLSLLFSEHCATLMLSLCAFSPFYPNPNPNPRSSNRCWTIIRSRALGYSDAHSTHTYRIHFSAMVTNSSKETYENITSCIFLEYTHK